MQLLGEEVDAQVSMLAGGVGGGDLDDLARATLKHQEVTDSDVVGGDGNGVCGGAGLNRDFNWVNVNVNFFSSFVVMMMARTSAHDALSSTVKTMPEGVVVT
jgi:hypothetical protein